MARLHIFNPEHEYSLAANRDYYTPASQIVELRRELALLPALYADREDAILLVDTPLTERSNLKFNDVAVEKNLLILTRSEAARLSHKLRDFRPDPWGWDRTIRQIFIDTVGEDMTGLPSLNQIDAIRELSHRRTTIRIFDCLADIIDDEIEKPIEIFNVNEGMDFWRMNGEIYFKAPWSSSGRGIVLTDDLEEKHVEPWLRGIIARQGSVLMEKAYKRALDFATEWEIADGGAIFKGYSIFNVSRRGKYHSNVRGSQKELLKRITDAARGWSIEWLDRQKDAIEKVIAPGYTGPIGIDMLITESGAVNPCVEINLRHTMGMIELEL